MLAFYHVICSLGCVLFGGSFGTVEDGRQFDSQGATDSEQRIQRWIPVFVLHQADPPGAGLWLSRDNGKTWRAFDELPFSNIQRVEFDPADDAVIHVTTFGGSVWRGPATPSEP